MIQSGSGARSRAWPASLVALELACWAGVMALVGIIIAGVEQELRH